MVKLCQVIATVLLIAFVLQSLGFYYYYSSGRHSSLAAPMVKATDGAADKIVQAISINPGEEIPYIHAGYSLEIKGNQPIGTILRKNLPAALRNLLDKKIVRSNYRPDVSVPEHYDIREVLGDYISSPINQGNCGACYAFAVTSALTDRIRLANKDHFTGKVDIDGQIVMNQLSPYLTAGCSTCDKKGVNKDFRELIISAKKCANESSPCDGGVIEWTVGIIANNGMLSLSCNATEGAYKCHSLVGYGYNNKTHKCVTWKFRGVNKVHLLESDQLKTALEKGDTNKLALNEDYIKQEIFLHGPVAAGMDIYQSFYEFYKKPENARKVYNFVPAGDISIGGHAVTICGWGSSSNSSSSNGSEGGEKYWICRNWWGDKWGDQGYFYILRGTNLCDIESDVWSSQIDLPASFATVKDQPAVAKDEHSSQTAKGIRHIKTNI
jgi:hypothetical protein